MKNIYRITGHDLGETFIYKIERKCKFLFFHYWKSEQHKIFYSAIEAEQYLPTFIENKKAVTKIKYYHIMDYKIISADSEMEL